MRVDALYLVVPGFSRTHQPWAPCDRRVHQPWAHVIDAWQDPSNSFYLQDPSGGWDGLAHFGSLVSSYVERYQVRDLAAIWPRGACQKSSQG